MREERFRKYVRIGVASALMLATVFVVGFSIRSSQSQAIVTEALEQDRPELPYEAGVFRRFDGPLTTPRRRRKKTQNGPWSLLLSACLLGRASRDSAQSARRHFFRR